jgi:acetyl-CoA carboxylase carboxyltransferase component
MHSEVSGLSDFLAEDEMDALRLCRNVVLTFTLDKRRSLLLSLMLIAQVYLKKNY